MAPKKEVQNNEKTQACVASSDFESLMLVLSMPIQKAEETEKKKIKEKNGKHGENAENL